MSQCEIHLADYKELLLTIQDESVDLLLSDPPYGVNYQNNYTKQKHRKILNDTSNFSYGELAEQAYRVLKPNSALLLFTGWSTYPDHYKQVEAAGFKMKEPLICQKRPSGTTDLLGSFQTNSDWLIFAHKGRFTFRPTELLRNVRAGTIPNKGRKPVPEFKRRFPSGWFGPEFPWASENPAFQKKHNLHHPTIKSLKFIRWLIKLCSSSSDVVLDPFVGSGTVALASKLEGRSFVGSEIDPEYFSMSLRRLRNMV